MERIVRLGTFQPARYLKEMGKCSESKFETQETEPRWPLHLFQWAEIWKFAPWGNMPVVVAFGFRANLFKLTQCPYSCQAKLQKWLTTMIYFQKPPNWGRIFFYGANVMSFHCFPLDSPGRAVEAKPWGRYRQAEILDSPHFCLQKGTWHCGLRSWFIPSKIEHRFLVTLLDFHLLLVSCEGVFGNPIGPLGWCSLPKKPWHDVLPKKQHMNSCFILNSGIPCQLNVPIAQILWHTTNWGLICFRVLAKLCAKSWSKKLWSCGPLRIQNPQSFFDVKTAVLHPLNDLGRKASFALADPTQPKDTKRTPPKRISFVTKFPSPILVVILGLL